MCVFLHSVWLFIVHLAKPIRTMGASYSEFIKNCCNFVRWTVLPEMPLPSFFQSALLIGTEDDNDDADVLVVGGCGGTGREAALLTNRPHRARGDQGNRGGQWRWQRLPLMQEARPCRPGLLLLGGGRVLVCGGGDGLFCWSKTAEILQRDDNGDGVWTLLSQEMTHCFSFTYLVNFNNRIVAVGESLITLTVVK